MGRLAAQAGTCHVERANRPQDDHRSVESCLMSDDLLIDERPVRRRFYSRWLGGALGPGRDRHWLWRLLKWLGLALWGVIVLFFPGRMMLAHETNDDPNFSAAPVDQTASAEQRPSQAVA